MRCSRRAPPLAADESRHRGEEIRAGRVADDARPQELLPDRRITNPHSAKQRPDDQNGTPSATTRLPVSAPMPVGHMN